MTNGEIYDIFCKAYPDMHADDYRPLSKIWVGDKQGIAIFMDNGDILLYFPEVKDEN